MYQVNVSSLSIREQPSNKSRLYLKLGTVVEQTGEMKKFKNQMWIPVITVNNPIVSGYVLKKYLKEVI